jgi:hypothetical protein
MNARFALAVSIGCSLLHVAPSHAADDCAVTSDGYFAEELWAAARWIDAGHGATLAIVSTPLQVCIGLKTKAAGLRYADIFLLDGAGGGHNLHASMQVGERALPKSDWSDAIPQTSWGQTTLWSANHVRRKSGTIKSAPLAEQFEASDGYEFKIDRLRMPKPWRVRIEVRDFEGAAPDIVWPSGSTRQEPSSWHAIPEANTSACSTPKN